MIKKQIKLYNVIFPVWFLLFFPISWLIVLPSNFLIDSAVLLITLKCLKVPDIKNFYKKSIIRIWLFGFLADLVGAAVLLITQFDFGNWWYENITSPVAYNPFKNGFAIVYVLLAVVVSAFLIFLLNYKFAWNKTSLEKEKKRVIALVLAIVTAPYLFFLPSKLFYKSPFDRATYPDASKAQDVSSMVPNEQFGVGHLIHYYLDQKEFTPSGNRFGLLPYQESKSTWKCELRFCDTVTE